MSHTNNETVQSQLERLKPQDMVIIKPEHDYSTTAAVVSVDQTKRVITATVAATKCGKYSIGQQVEFPFHDIESINGVFVMSRLMRYSGWHPDVDMVVEVANKQTADPTIRQETILWESLQWMAQRANSERLAVIRAYTEPVHIFVQKMTQMDEFHSMASMAKALLASAVDVPEAQLAKADTFQQHMHSYNKVHLALLNMGMQELREVLTPEAQARLMSDIKK